MNTKDEKKTTNEKNLSLLPLPFDELIDALLHTTKKPKEDKKPSKKSSTK